MSTVPAIHLATTPAFHLPPRIGHSALAVVGAVFLATASTMMVGGHDIARARSATDATRITAPCDFGPYRDAWWATGDPTPDLAVSPPCQKTVEPCAPVQRSILPAGRKPAAWYLGGARAATPRP